MNILLAPVSVFIFLSWMLFSNDAHYPPEFAAALLATHVVILGASFFNV
jgi:hypothetical protein